MVKKTGTVRVDTTPSYTTCCVVIGIAALFSWYEGFNIGANLVEGNKVGLDASLDAMVGGYAGMGIFFGLILQALGVDLMRLGPMQRLDERVAKGERWVFARLFPCQTQATDYVASASVSDIESLTRPVMQQLHSPSPSPAPSVCDPELLTLSVVQQPRLRYSPSAVIRLGVDRLGSYALTFVVGASATLCPVYIAMYKGIEIFLQSDRVEHDCLYVTLALWVLQVKLMSMACRADQRAGSLTYTEADQTLGVPLRFGS